MKLLEAVIVAILAVIFYLTVLTILVSVWTLIFTFLGWMFPDFFAWVFEVLRTPNGKPWMIGVALGLVALAFSRSTSKGN